MWESEAGATCWAGCFPSPKIRCDFSPLLRAPSGQVLEAVRKLGLEGVVGNGSLPATNPASDQAHGSSTALTENRSLSLAVTSPGRTGSMRCSWVFTKGRPHLRREGEERVCAADSGRVVPRAQGVANCPVPVQESAREKGPRDGANRLPRRRWTNADGSNRCWSARSPSSNGRTPNI